ncbi:Os07g0186150 [Oryza sativa Japonica Group]|uniref:Os07g0186150 protein n=1 Tax=Oryza sativa subsp. japonica TaxID=39947 RepID=A0A0P0X3L3_ORYSJ|nr:hypothetical protein EE612_037552 [Oryza sativa]BAT00376.1 Os07g0186150 [Oryza sativa Japonica Group]
MDSELVLLLFKTMARLPSLEILSCACFSSGPVMGFSLLATQAVVKTWILLNHMPRYQPGNVLVVVLMDLLMPAVGCGWKKPSANLPFLETSFSPTESAWPTMRVSPSAMAAEHGGVCREERRSPLSSSKT